MRFMRQCRKFSISNVSSRIRTFELNNSFTNLAIRQAATDLRVAEKVLEFWDGPGSKGFLENFQRMKGFIGKFQKVL